MPPIGRWAISDEVQFLIVDQKLEYSTTPLKIGHFGNGIEMLTVRMNRKERRIHHFGNKFRFTQYSRF